MSFVSHRIETPRYKSSLPSRDWRVDLVRGLALLVLVTDHLPQNVLRNVMPVALGLADMADVFLLLSGYVFGMNLKRRGNGRVRRRHVIRRAAVLYGSYCLTGVLTVWLVRQFQIGSVGRTLPPHLLANHWLGVFRDIVLLNGQISHLCILLLYFWLAVALCLLPSRIWKSPLGVLVCSAVVYLGTQLTDLFVLPADLQRTTFYNPFAWQFLFVTGACWAIVSPRSRWPHAWQRYVLPLATVLMGSLLIGIGLGWRPSEQLINKSSFGVFRSLHVLSSAVVVAEFLPVAPSPRIRQWTRPITLCSEQSLWVYCGGTLFVVLLAQPMVTTASVYEQLGLNLVAWLGCVLIAQVVSWKRLRRQSPHVPADVNSHPETPGSPH